MKRGLIVMTCAALLIVRPAAAQTFTDSTLALAVRLVSEGQGDSARALVRATLARLPRTDSLYPEALFAAGMVADSLGSALAAFRQVSLDYSNSPWAANALLRIAQLSFAAGDLATAGRSADRVLTDYPLSDVRAQAAYWAGRVRIAEGKTQEACPYLQQAVAEAGTDIELANRARYHLQRCETAVAPRDTTTKPAARTTTVYAVQVAAVGSATAADDAMRSLSAAGYQSRVVRDTDGLFKVRVGPFATRAEAQRVQAEIKHKVGGSPFIVEEQR
jgi:tetratricopeptide (TPR) repeat protein